MGRAIGGAIVVAIIAIVLFFLWSQHQNRTIAQLNQQIATLNQQAGVLKAQNAELTSHLNRVQQEEDHLAAQNDMLNRALAQAKATGKVPALRLPYPPK